MAELPEIGTLSNKAIAKLVGLAPIASDSGRRSGRRPVRGGREGPRSSLSLVALTVARYGPRPGAFHQSEAGRKGKGGDSHCARPQATRHSECKGTRCAHRVGKCNLDTPASRSLGTNGPYLRLLLEWRKP
ncbi:transposase [Mesorhizobium sp. M0520]|uniref:transposase n=1 Tax=unclassified Mesorhizobium TaxID=325217 RepID=UPI00333C85D0